MKRPEMPPSRLISETGREWKPAFGLYWSPKEYQLLQKLDLLGTQLQPWEAQKIVHAARSLTFDRLCLGITIGWVASGLFLWALTAL